MSRREQKTTIFHATAISWQKQGILLKGASGAGKSDLALRLIDLGAILVADDLVSLYKKEDALVIALPDVPESLKGKIELYGMGIIDMPYIPSCPLKLVVTLINSVDESRPRIPPARFFNHEGVNIPWIDCYPFQSSAPLKLIHFLKSLGQKSPFFLPDEEAP